VTEINDEIRAVQDYPGSSEQAGQLKAFAARVPRFGCLFFFGILKMNPQWF
jgi:hypothetical protein